METNDNPGPPPSSDKKRLPLVGRLARALGAGDALPIDPDLAPDDAGSPSPAHLAHAPHGRRARPGVLVAIAAGGFAGTLARYEVELAWPAGPGQFPAATFAINTSGAFLLGLFLAAAVERRRPGPHLRPFVATGLLGGWTTYSTLAVEAVTLSKGGHSPTALLPRGEPGGRHGRRRRGHRPRPGEEPLRRRRGGRRRSRGEGWSPVILAVVVGLAGGAGAVVRYLADGAVEDRVSGPLPWGTLAVNVTGSLILGLLTGLLWYHGLAARDRSVLGVGFCGGLTTWSTASWESVRLAEGGLIRQAVVFTLGGLLAALVAASVGIALAAAL